MVTEAVELWNNLENVKFAAGLFKFTRPDWKKPQSLTKIQAEQVSSVAEPNRSREMG